MEFPKTEFILIRGEGNHNLGCYVVISFDFPGIAQMKVGFITFKKIGVQIMVEALPEIPTSTNVLK